jgi:hypothetical protein
MADQTNPDPLELLKFLREQAEANRESLRQEAQANRAAQREESESIRKLFTATSTIVAIPLAVALTLAGIFWFRDMNSMKEALEKEGKAAEQAEIDKMNSHIDSTLQEQFTTKSMQDRIDKAAELATEGKAKTLIEDRVRAMTEPLQLQAQTELSSIHAQELIARVNSDDARAYDELLKIRANADPQQRGLIDGVISDRHRKEYQQTLMFIQGNEVECADPASTRFHDALSAPDPQERLRVIDSCRRYLEYQSLDIWLPGQKTSGVDTEELIPPVLVDIALHDQFLSVRFASISALNTAFKYSPGFPDSGLDPLDAKQLASWWDSNKDHYRYLQLLSIVAPPGSTRFDLISLFDEVLKQKQVAPQTLQHEFSLMLERMRVLAEHRNSDSHDSLVKKMGRSTCSEVEKDFTIRIGTEWNESKYSMEVRGEDDYGMLELQFLKNCDSDSDIARKLAPFIAQSHYLERRYGAVILFNKWTGSQLDPFDSNNIRKWWNSNKGSYTH